MIIFGVIFLRKWWPKMEQRWPKTVHLPYTFIFVNILFRKTFVNELGLVA